MKDRQRSVEQNLSPQRQARFGSVFEESISPTFQEKQARGNREQEAALSDKQRQWNAFPTDCRELFGPGRFRLIIMNFPASEDFESEEPAIAKKACTGKGAAPAPESGGGQRRASAARSARRSRPSSGR